MTNNKLKIASSTRAQKLRDEVLFIRSFGHDCDLSADDVGQELETLAYERGKLASVFYPRRQTVAIDQLSDNRATFHIKSKLGGLYTQLNATGTIHHDQATGRTHITGDVKFDPIYLTVLLAGLFFLITWATASLTHLGVLPSPFILFTLGLTNLFYFRQMFLDRNALLKTLDSTFNTRDLSTARQRLADDISTINETDIHYSHQQSSSHEISS